jgi:glutaryl-CoA dehydrogenase (non-decarboxylating)
LIVAAENLLEAQTRFREFCAKQIRPRAEEFDRNEKLAPDVPASMAAEGLFGLTVDIRHGGLGTDMVTWGLLHEEMGRACGSCRSLLTVHEMVCYAIERWGAKEQKKQWLPLLASGAVLGALAASESSAGSDLSAVETRAIEKNDAYILSGRKRWISFGQIAGLFLVLARLEAALAAFLVERGTPGVSVKPMIAVTGLKASMLAEIAFDEAEIPRRNLVGRVGFGLSHVFSAALHHGKYSVAWGCVGVAQECLSLALEEAGSRIQFGAPICDHQLVKRMISNMAVNTQAARLMCLHSGTLIDRRDPESVFQTMAAKYFASEVAAKSADDAVQIHGAWGLRQEAAVNRLWRDARVMRIIEGSTEMQQIMIADHQHACAAAGAAMQRERL